MTPLLTPTPTNWYDRTWLVIALCLLFFPVGLYGLWKSTMLSQAGKLVGTTVLIALALVDWARPDSDANSGFKAATASITAEQ